MAANQPPPKRAAEICRTPLTDLPSWHVVAFCEGCELLVRRPLARFSDGGTVGDVVNNMLCLICGTPHLDVWVRHQVHGKPIPVRGKPVWRAPPR